MAERSIPAHAGEPVREGGLANLLMVYPRPRGGTVSTTRASTRSWGLSPPTRGNRSAPRAARARARSIPAHAGEPAPTPLVNMRPRVYPRPRGGTSHSVRRASRTTGLSPPTRGNRESPQRTVSSSGSIPAHAGEPVNQSTRIRAAGVYPRPRGGTRRRRVSANGGGGLSPPTRGNLSRRVC